MREHPENHLPLLPSGPGGFCDFKISSLPSFIFSGYKPSEKEHTFRRNSAPLSGLWVTGHRYLPA